MSGLRNWSNANPALATGVVIALLGAMGFLFFHHGGVNPPPLPQFATSCYYSDDDGATYFADEINKPTPFDHNGKQAYRAHVFSADGGQHRWVGFLESSGASSGADLSPAGIKAPGEGKWVRMMSPSGVEVMKVKVPPGMGTEPPKEIFP